MENRFQVFGKCRVVNLCLLLRAFFFCSVVKGQNLEVEFSNDSPKILALDGEIKSSVLGAEAVIVKSYSPHSTFE
ncbi:hypothetical protein PanWU01x14_220200, partial [Parasponia andersonii]